MNLSANNPGSLTLGSLTDAIDAIKKLRDPIAEKMKAAGFDPEEGGLLFLPYDLRADNWGPFGPPSYVRFSKYVDYPMFVRDPWPRWNPSILSELKGGAR